MGEAWGAHMEPEAFYRKLVAGLSELDFAFRESDLSQDDVEQDDETVAASVRAATQFAPAALQALTGTTIAGLFSIDPVFDSDALEEGLRPVRVDASLVAFKYLLAQPVILAVVEADELEPDDAIAIAGRFDTALQGLRPLSAMMGGVTLWGWRFGGTRGSVAGFLLYTFFDSEKAAKFRERTQRRCKVVRYWRKTLALPWVCDVAKREVHAHRGLPWTLTALGANGLQTAVFDSNQ